MSDVENNNEISLVDYLRVIKKHWRMMVVAFLLTPLAILVASLFWPKYFQAETLVGIGQANFKCNQADKTELNFLQTEAAALIFLTNYPEIKAMGQNLDIQSMGEGYLVFRAKAHSASKALEMVRRASDILIQEHQRFVEQRSVSLMQQKGIIEKERDSAKVKIVVLEKNMGGVSANQRDTDSLALGAYLARISVLEQEIISIDKLAILDMTQVKGEPRVTIVFGRPFLKRLLMISFILGFFISIVLAYAKEWWQRNKLKV